MTVVAIPSCLPFVIRTGTLCLAILIIINGGGSGADGFSTKPTVASSSASTATLADLQQQAGAIAASFEPTTFDPWIRNCHVQTIAGFFLRDTVASYVPRNEPWGAAQSVLQGILQVQKRKRDKSHEKNSRSFWDSRKRIETDDGDWFHADTKYPSTDNLQQEQQPSRHVILVHGLESNSNSSLSQQIAQACIRENMKVTCLNFRSCSMGDVGDVLLNDTPGAYHLGFTDDLKHFLKLNRAQFPNEEIYLTGFSLGANVVLKALGELGTSAVSDYNICGAAVANAPFEQERNARALARPGINRIIYTNALLKSLKAKAIEDGERFGIGNKNKNNAETLMTAADATNKLLFDLPRALAAKTITEFDDAFIAPIYGFQDCWDYYKKTSSIYFIEDIAVPTLVVNARDDPFFDPTVHPVDKTILGGGRAPLQIVQTESGGHCGFCFQQVDREEGSTTYSSNSNSWMPTELARFFKHVQKQR